MHSQSSAGDMGEDISISTEGSAGENQSWAAGMLRANIEPCLILSPVGKPKGPQQIREQGKVLTCFIFVHMLEIKEGNNTVGSSIKR